MILILSGILPLAGIPLTFGRKSMRRSLFLFVSIAILSFTCAAISLATTSREEVIRLSDDLLVNDTSSRLFIALISAVFTGVALYIYNRALTNPFSVRKIQKFIRSAFLFYAISTFAILSNHFILMWLLLEATTLAIAPLIYHQKGAPSVRAAWKYFVFSTAGLGLAFVGFIFISIGMHGHVGGGEVSFYFHELFARQEFLGVHPWRELGLAFVIFGFGAKLGLAPMYSWLPEAYDLSPPSVTVLLSAIQFNVAMLAVFRVFQYFRPLESPLIRYELIVIGLVSIVISAFHIVVAKNYKRLIAYASINHAGVIAVGLGIGKSAAYGVVLYVISNALVKAVLFLTCGNIKARYHTKNIADLHGLIKTMPFSGGVFMVGIFALLGFAPFGSFFGEVLIMKSMIDGQHFAVFTFFCLVTTVVFVAMGRATFPMIWGEPNHEVSLHGESIYTLLPNLFFIVLLLSLGVYLPAGANALLQSVAAQLGGQ
ncbi:proton-conducting transporter membrane subunit [Bdellovibrionota bacterium FG-2]